jgi:hypothetical protein
LVVDCVFKVKGKRRFNIMEFRENQAIYLQIAELICERILLKQWASEDKVPSVRELAVQLEVNPNTVMRTYDFLEQKVSFLPKEAWAFCINRCTIK